MDVLKLLSRCVYVYLLYIFQFDDDLSSMKQIKSKAPAYQSNDVQNVTGIYFAYWIALNKEQILSFFIPKPSPTTNAK